MSKDLSDCIQLAQKRFQICMKNSKKLSSINNMSLQLRRENAMVTRIVRKSTPKKPICEHTGSIALLIKLLGNHRRPTAIGRWQKFRVSPQYHWHWNYVRIGIFVENKHWYHTPRGNRVNVPISKLITKMELKSSKGFEERKHFIQNNRKSIM